MATLKNYFKIFLPMFSRANKKLALFLCRKVIKYFFIKNKRFIFALSINN